jgi:CheY-like chemotaxis protein
VEGKQAMGKKILLADDSITIQKVIELTFSDEDFEVVTVGNGRLAMEKVQEVRPDVVLCDIIMPEKDGYEVCDFIKKNPALAHTPVLLLTGAFEPFDQERAARVRCDGYLAKPFEPETLIAKVKELLAKAPPRPATGAFPAAPRPAAVPWAETHTPAPAPPPPPPIPVATAPPPLPPMPAPAPPSAPPHPTVAAPAASAAPFAAPSAPTFAPSVPFAPAVPYETLEEPPEMDVTFIPDEPFESLDEASFEPDPPAAPAAPPAPPPPPAPAFIEPSAFDAPLYAEADEAPVEELLPITAEESESLSAPVDTGATVMFQVQELPWSASPEPLVEEPLAHPAPTAPHAPPPPTAELPVFEEVLEEEPAPASSATASFHAVTTAPPLPEPEPLVERHPEPLPLAAAPPPPPLPAEPPAPAPPLAAAPPVSAAEEPEVSFADLAATMPGAAPVERPSEAAEVAVPVDMVEKIAQRVVAQISEKVVRQIAWEVIPDLAEAMIKKEIERLKAELQETS